MTRATKAVPVICIGCGDSIQKSNDGWNLTSERDSAMRDSRTQLAANDQFNFTIKRNVGVCVCVCVCAMLKFTQKLTPSMQHAHIS